MLALTTPDIWLIRTFHDEVWVPELTGEQWVDDREECTFLGLIPARETLRAKTPRLSRNNAQWALAPFRIRSAKTEPNRIRCIPLTTKGFPQIDSKMGRGVAADLALLPPAPDQPYSGGRSQRPSLLPWGGSAPKHRH